MKIYKSRYLASKENDGDVIVNVCGGYRIMSNSDYKIWKQQK